MIDVNWSAVDSEAKKRLDLNKDGVLDVKDAMIATQSVSDYLSRRMPFGGGKYQRASETTVPAS